MKIAIDEIKLIFESLIERLEKDKIETLEIETDYYWIVLSDEWDDLSSKSPSVAVGSLIDDWNSLQDVVTIERVTYLDLEQKQRRGKAFGQLILWCLSKFTARMLCPYSSIFSLYF